MKPIDKIEELFSKADNETKAGNFVKAIVIYEKIIKLAKKNKRAKHIAHWGIGEIYLDNGERLPKNSNPF